jgi:adiponectin receptor
MFLTLSPRFGSPQFRNWRATFYAGFGLSSILFVINGLVLYGWEAQNGRMSLVWMGWMATANLAGAAIYAARVSVVYLGVLVASADAKQIPEKWAPCTFDILGASHQLFHIAVVAAAWLHFLGLVESFHTVRCSEHSCRVR